MNMKRNQNQHKQWMLPEHTSTSKSNISKNYPRITITNAQKELIEKITKEHQEKGYLEGKKVGLQEMLAQKKILVDLINAFQGYQDKCDQLLEAQIVELVKQICLGVLKYELNDKYNLNKLVHDALEEFKSKQTQFHITANELTVQKFKELDIAEFNTKYLVDNQYQDFAFKIDNHQQVIAFSIENSLSSYINNKS